MEVNVVNLLRRFIDCFLSANTVFTILHTINFINFKGKDDN